MHARPARLPALLLGCLVAGCALEWTSRPSDAGMDAEIRIVDIGLEDAANAVAPTADGEVVQGLMLGDSGDASDPRWQDWVGRYAARTIVHGFDGFLRPRSMELSLVVIEPRGGRLVLEQQLCVLEGSWSHLLVDGGTPDPQEAIFRVNYASLSFVTELVLKENSFDTKPARYQIGFKPSPACVPASVAASTQPWLSGECTCPNETGEVPTTSSDCRLTDPELDGQPGATVHAALNGDKVDFYVAQQVEIRYTEGFRADGRLFAGVEASESHAVFGCTAPELTENCAFGTATICAPEHNEIVFVRLSDLEHDEYDCARVVREHDGLFPGALPEFPNACGAER